MRRLPGSQLCSGRAGHPRCEAEAQRLSGPRQQQRSRRRRRWAPNERNTPTGAISAELPGESTADLLGQQVPQIPTSSLAEEDGLLRNGAGHGKAEAASGGHHGTAVRPGRVAAQALFERRPRCSALSPRDSAFPSHLLSWAEPSEPAPSEQQAR